MNQRIRQNNPRIRTTKTELFTTPENLFLGYTKDFATQLIDELELKLTLKELMSGEHTHRPLQKNELPCLAAWFCVWYPSAREYDINLQPVYKFFHTNLKQIFEVVKLVKTAKK